MIIQICVGSSCHLKGSQQIIELFKSAVDEYKLNDEVTLAGSFCMGKCSGDGVAVQFDDDTESVTTENFKDVFQKCVLNKISK